MSLAYASYIIAISTASPRNIISITTRQSKTGQQETYVTCSSPNGSSYKQYSLRT